MVYNFFATTFLQSGIYIAHVRVTCCKRFKRSRSIQISLCLPFILGTSSLSAFSTIGHKEQEKLGKQFEKMRFERKSFESMKGEQIA